MYYYRLYGQIVCSDIKSERLVPAAETSAFDIRITEGAFPAHLKQESNSYYFYSQEEAYVVNSYCYLYATGGNKLLFERKGPADDSLTEAYLLGWGISMLLQQQGKPALHGSCLSQKGHAFLIGGPSGSGKSTVTSALLKKGFRLMADDLTAVAENPAGGFLAYPAFPSQKACTNELIEKGLDPESFLQIDPIKNKYLIPWEGDFSTEPEPLSAIFLMSAYPGDRLIFEEIPGVQKWHACMDTLFLRPVMAKEIFNMTTGPICLKLASAVPMYRIFRPHNIDTRDEVIQQIEHIISNIYGD